MLVLYFLYVCIIIIIIIIIIIMDMIRYNTAYHILSYRNGTVDEKIYEINYTRKVISTKKGDE